MAVSATPALLEALTDRELALKLLEMEGQLWNEIQAFERRLTGEFGQTLTQAVERLSPGVEEAYCEGDRDA